MNKIKAIMDRLISSTRWGRTFVDTRLYGMILNAKSRYLNHGIEPYSKSEPRISKTVYPDGRVVKHT